MLTKNDLLESVLHECKVVHHLVTKMPEGGWSYRQSATQRSNLELLQYLTYCGIGGMSWVLDQTYDAYKEWQEKHGGITVEEFPAAMETQVDALSGRFAELTDEDLAREASLPMGQKTSVARALVEMPVKWMTAYRMQLFCGIKAAGNEEIWTPDCWGGVSMPRDAKPTS